MNTLLLPEPNLKMKICLILKATEKEIIKDELAELKVGMDDLYVCMCVCVCVCVCVKRRGYHVGIRTVWMCHYRVL